MDAAWLTVEYAVESGTLTAGDIVWVRRNVNELPITDIAPAYNGTATAWIEIIGCPRGTFAIASSDWTNGSTSVNVDDGGMTREAHQGRYITAPDGRIYLITRVSGVNTIIIDREYAGATVTNQAATISADEDYATFQAIDDSAWTIKKANWNADAHTLPRIDFNDAAYQISNARNYTAWKNLDLIDSNDADGIMWNYNSNVIIIGCLLKQYTLTRAVYRHDYVSAYIQRTIFEGCGGSGTAQYLFIHTYSTSLWMKDCALYGSQYRGFYNNNSSGFLMENVNIGVEIANAGHDIIMSRADKGWGRDLKLGGTNGYVVAIYYYSHLLIENYQKILGAHRTWYPFGYVDKVAISSPPNKKVSDYIMKISPVTSALLAANSPLALPILEYDIEALAGIAKTYRFWIYNDLGSTLNDTTAKDNIWLKASYVSGYNDTSEYQTSEVFSAQIDILDAADADDWDYLEVTVNPAVTSKVRLSIYFNFYDATDVMYIDPALSIS
jgi:hypothetical protein